MNRLVRAFGLPAALAVIPATFYFLPDIIRRGVHPISIAVEVLCVAVLVLIVGGIRYILPEEQASD